MLLNEIAPFKTMDELDNKMKEAGFPVVGTGGYATAYSDVDKGISKIIKVNQDPVYQHYLDAITDANNPYFPQVDANKAYNVDKWNRDTFHSTFMERLVSFDSLTPAQLTTVCQRLGIGEDYPKITKDNTEMIMNLICQDLAGMICGWEQIPMKAREDKHFVDAINVISDLITDGYGEIDMHAGNIMFRLTPYGPQLVFTDPIAE